MISNSLAPLVKCIFAFGTATLKICSIFNGIIFKLSFSRASPVRRNTNRHLSISLFLYLFRLNRENIEKDKTRSMEQRPFKSKHIQDLHISAQMNRGLVHALQNWFQLWLVRLRLQSDLRTMILFSHAESRSNQANHQINYTTPEPPSPLAPREARLCDTNLPRRAWPGNKRRWLIVCWYVGGGGRSSDAPPTPPAPLSCTAEPFFGGFRYWKMLSCLSRRFLSLISRSKK